jgi:small conductance mechanosensitive channel
MGVWGFGSVKGGREVWLNRLISTYGGTKFCAMMLRGLSFGFPALAGFLMIAVGAWTQGWAQNAVDAPRTAPEDDELTIAPSRVAVNPVARDDEIRLRLLRVLEATDWFTEPQVAVEEGVVFLSGRVESAELKKWAGDLARNTEEVVAVANQMVVTEPEVWDLRPGWEGLLALWRDFVRSIPFLLFGLLILGLSGVMGVVTVRMARSGLETRIKPRLLRNVAAVACGVLVFLIGTYIVLRVSGLTQLALTVVGGTGLIGLAVGIAFRDITENFLASIFLSMQRPFETGDLIEVTGVTGYVQQLNVRVTILMTLE